MLHYLCQANLCVQNGFVHLYEIFKTHFLSIAYMMHFQTYWKKKYKFEVIKIIIKKKYVFDFIFLKYNIYKITIKFM